MFVCELNGCGFESSWSHLNFKFRTCFEQGVPWYSGNYRVWIHSETCTWHDKNIQSIKFNFISNNVKGLQSYKKRLKFFECLEKNGPNGILFLQKAHSMKENEIRWNDDFKGQIILFPR